MRAVERDNGDDSDAKAPEPKTIGLAISGGGHRATVFALGALLYLVDCGWIKRVQTITSVSGGSILNAFIALITAADGQKRPIRAFGAGEFDVHAAALAACIAGRRWAWIATALAMSGAAVASLLVWWVMRLEGLHMLGALAAALLGLAVFLGPWAGGSLWGWWGAWAYCGCFLWLVVAVVILEQTSCPAVFWSSLILIATVAAWLLQRRSWIAEKSFEHLLRKLGCGTRPTLEAMNTEVRHVFCATELHSGQQAFFSHDFVYARGFGLGKHGQLPVATVVQVSANFPGGFPIRPLAARQFGFAMTDRFEEAVEQGVHMGRDILLPDEHAAWMIKHQRFVEENRPLPRRLMLTDGGVFDNLAVDWYLRNEERLDRFKLSLNREYDPTTGKWDLSRGLDEERLHPLREQCDDLVIINSGVTTHWSGGLEVSARLPFAGEAMGFSQITSTMYNNSTKQRIAGLSEYVVVEMGVAERMVRTTLLPLGRGTTAGLLNAGYSYTKVAIAQKYSLREPASTIGEAIAERAARFEQLAAGRAWSRSPGRERSRP